MRGLAHTPHQHALERGSVTSSTRKMLKLFCPTTFLLNWIIGPTPSLIRQSGDTRLANCFKKEKPPLGIQLSQAGKLYSRGTFPCQTCLLPQRQCWRLVCVPTCVQAEARTVGKHPERLQSWATWVCLIGLVENICCGNNSKKEKREQTFRQRLESRAHALRSMVAGKSQCPVWDCLSKTAENGAEGLAQHVYG